MIVRILNDGQWHLTDDADQARHAAAAVDADLDLVRELQAGQVADDVAERTDGEGHADRHGVA